MNKTKLLILQFLFLAFTGNAQYNEHNFGVAINMVYTTSAEVFLNPNSSDIVLRNESFLVEDIINPGIDLRYRISDEFILGLNIEYIKKTASGPNLTAFVGSRVFVFEVEDGFKVIPIELTAHYFFPFSTEQFKFAMGGGIGYYRGEFIRKFSDTELSILERKLAIGIHVSGSMDYMFLDNLSLRFEMKFRDPQFNVISKYTKTELIFEGNTIVLPEDSFETKVNINGVTFVLGAVIHL